MPRERHELMRSYLSQRGTRALEMMHATCTVQANFDYQSEADAGRKLRMAAAAAPVVTALWANSSISGGQTNGFESRRAWVWRDTDDQRCGLLPFVFEPDWSEAPYRRYTEWALDVPMFFVVRDGKHLSAQGLTFRGFYERGFGEHRATLADWNVHLTTLFPEVRLKRVIEVRSADAVPPGLVCALPAFWKGLLYDDTSLSAAAELLAGWSHADADALNIEVARVGLAAVTPDGPVLEVARALGPGASRGRAEDEPFDSLVIGLTMARSDIYERIDRRIDGMIESGWVEEVAALLKQGVDPKLPSFGAIGYRELAAHLSGEGPLDEAVAAARSASRRLVRQQYGWFPLDDSRIHWVDVTDDPEEPCITVIRRWMKDGDGR